MQAHNLLVTAHGFELLALSRSCGQSYFVQSLNNYDDWWQKHRIAEKPYDPQETLVPVLIIVFAFRDNCRPFGSASCRYLGMSSWIRSPWLPLVFHQYELVRQRYDGLQLRGPLVWDMQLSNNFSRFKRINWLPLLALRVPHWWIDRMSQNSVADMLGIENKCPGSLMKLHAYSVACIHQKH